MAEKDFYDVDGIGKLPDDDGETAQPRAHRSFKAPRKSHISHKALTLLIILILIAGVAGGYSYLKNHKAGKAVTTTSHTTEAPSSTDSTSNGTKHYISLGTDLKLEFDYPSNWSVTPTSGASGDKTITVSSPAVSITDASGASINGKVVVTIRPSTAGLTEFADTTTATATQDSSQIAYAAPTVAQHQYTYLTFVHFATGSKTPGAFEEVLVTGSQQFHKDDSVTADSFANLDPIIAANFYKCSTSDCSGKGTGLLSITANSWQNDTFVEQVQKIFESLKLH